MSSDGAQGKKKTWHSRLWAQKVHSVRGTYGRIFAFSSETVANLDPDRFSVTNEWEWPALVDVELDMQDPRKFRMTLPKAGLLFGESTEVMTFSTLYRKTLLTDLYQWWERGKVG